MAANNFFECFVCNTNQQNLADFNTHLNSMEHVKCLADRNLLAMEHFELLLRVHNFSFSENLAKHSLNGSAASDYNDGVQNFNGSFDSLVNLGNLSLADGREPIRETSTKSKPNSADKKKPANDISIECLLCRKVLKNRSSIFQHSVSKGHKSAIEDANQKDPNVKVFKCDFCLTDFHTYNGALKHANKQCKSSTTSTSGKSKMK